MLMSAIESVLSVASYPELAGKRVLITGLSASRGVDIARAFAEHQARLVLQTDDTGAEMTAVGEMLAQSAVDLKLFAGPLETTDKVVRFARSAVTALGGLDAVINVVSLGGQGALDIKAVERRVSEVLTLPCLVSRIAANRMRLTFTEGIIITAAMLPPKATATDRAFACVAKATLAAMTRSQAQEWASQAVRFNAVAPQVSGLSSEPALSGEVDVAALALYLASGRGKSLTGHVFDAESR
jgi:NAD(P)-dependent dehydrogenase (short-subunit alcohol dehydrogenase family)